MRAPPICKKLESTISTINNLFQERYFHVSNEHKAIDGALAKCNHDRNGFRFEFTKMELASMDERNKFIDDSETPLVFEDNYNRIEFSPKNCTDFRIDISFSGFTKVSGIITEFTTECLPSHTSSHFRAVIPSSAKFGVSSHFAIYSLLHVGSTTYGSGVLEFSVNGINLQAFSYHEKGIDQNFFIIETVDECLYSGFVELLDEILLAITYLTGYFIGRELYIVGSKTEDFEKSEMLSLKHFFEDLKNGKNAIPDADIFHNLRMRVELCEPKYFSGLVQQLIQSLVLKRTVLLLCQAHSEPQYVRSSLYSVALETITGLIAERNHKKNNPLSDKSLIKSLITDLKKTLQTYESKLDSSVFSLFTGHLERINSPTNKQKLLAPFKNFGIKLPDKDADAIGKRNDFLHGRMPEFASQDELVILNGRILFCIDCLILKYVGYRGFIMYHPAWYQLHMKLKVEEYPIRLV